jgi:ribokinase
MKGIAVVGSMIVDLAVSTPRVPLTGENILAHSFQMGAGGKGANAAVAIAKLGAQPLLVGRVGQDHFGQVELEAVRSYGVRTEAVGIDPQRHTGIAIIMVDDNHENTILVTIGANAGLTEEAAQAALAPHWGELDALLVNFEIPEAVVRSVVQGARARKLPVIVDAGPPRNYGPQTWGQATVLSPNMLEASTLVGYAVENEADALRAARELLQQGPQAIVLKMGKRGAMLVTAQEHLLIPSFAVEAVDTTGAGDAFTAALVIGVAEERPWSETLRRANAAGAIAVTRFGAMAAMPSQDELESFLRK